MIYAVDTHALAWWLENDGRLTDAARNGIEHGEPPLLVPSLVLAELVHMGHKRGDVGRMLE